MIPFQNLQNEGRLAKIQIEITPLATSIPIVIDKFVDYRFSSNIIVPVDSFSFTFAAPDDPKTVMDYMAEGDIVSITADGVAISMGIIDSIDIDVDAETGERVTINGRDLMGQLADQCCVKPDCTPIYGKGMTLEQVGLALIESTRIAEVATADAPKYAGDIFATEPGETRLNALLRYLEPVNCLAWMDPNGTLFLGRPTMSGGPVGNIICNKKNRESNVLKISATFAATQAASVIAGLWSSVQANVSVLPKQQIFENPNARVQALKKRGHQSFKSIVSSIPSGATAEDFRSLAELQNAASNKKTVLEYMAQREFARENVNVLQVKAVMPGHFREDGKPYMPDEIYSIDFDRAKINDLLYCYGVEWSLSPAHGQQSVLSFCPLNSIVANTKAT
jgi:prophage tail gpP-like protein